MNLIRCRLSIIHSSRVGGVVCLMCMCASDKYVQQTHLKKNESLGRTHMNSCDFCVESYSFDETEDDFSLKDFDHNVTHDVEVGMIAMMKRADEVLRESWGSKEDKSDTNKKRDNADLVGMRIIASPWSPPSWMKAPTTWEEVKEGAVHAENMLGSALPVCLRDGAGKDSKYAEVSFL